MIIILNIYIYFITFNQELLLKYKTISIFYYLIIKYYENKLKNTFIYI